MDLLEETYRLIIPILAAYFLGSLPLATRISQHHGVDIFSSGTGLAGASNVRKTVGNWSGLLVLLGDIAKGALAIIIAKILGIDGLLILFPAAAVIFGHCKSIFTKFRGGDGLSTLGGVILALFPLPGLLSIIVSTLVSLGGQKMPYTSLLNIVAGYFALAAINLTFVIELEVTFGLGIIAALVFVNAWIGHVRRRNDRTDWNTDDQKEMVAVEQKTTP